MYCSRHFAYFLQVAHILVTLLIFVSLRRLHSHYSQAKLRDTYITAVNQSKAQSNEASERRLHFCSLVPRLNRPKA